MPRSAPYARNARLVANEISVVTNESSRNRTAHRTDHVDGIIAYNEDVYKDSTPAGADAPSLGVRGWFRNYRNGTRNCREFESDAVFGHDAARIR